MFELQGGAAGPGHTRAVEARPVAAISVEWRVPIALEAVHAGWPSAAQDYYSGEVDLNRYLIRDQAVTCVVRVVGDSMQQAGIFHDDELIVDRGLHPTHGCVVVAVIDGELTVKRLLFEGGGVVLRPENPNYPDIRVDELSELRIWGVVTRCLHRVD